MERELVIFDFDGTLADTSELFLRAFDEAAERHRFQPFDRANAAYVRTLDAMAVMAHHGVPLWKLPVITHSMRRAMEDGIGEVQMFDGVAEELHKLKRHGAMLALLTSNCEGNVVRVLGEETMGLFSETVCGTSVFGKRAKLNRLLGSAGMPASRAILIGDEVRDCEAAQLCSVAFGAVGWGYTDLAALMAAGAEVSFTVVGELAAKLAGVGAMERAG